jgi:L-threonylcarbamoyladenylate synthase
VQYFQNTMAHSIQDALLALKSGSLIGLPTETVYGLGADASNELAVRKIFAVKGRPSTHPLIVHVANLDEAQEWSTGLTSAAILLAKAFWPGPLTLIVNRSEKATDAVTGGQNTVGIRVPSHALALDLLKQFSGGIAAPSANRFGKVSPTTAQHVKDELGTDVSCVLDGGPCEVGVESTIVDVSTEIPRLLRPGGLSVERIESILGHTLVRATNTTDIRAPGLLESHYAPRAGLKLVTAQSLVSEIIHFQMQKLRVAVMAPKGIDISETVHYFRAPESDTEFAQILFATLRKADELADVILVVPPNENGLGLAIVDRLTRASTPRK